MPTWQCDLYYNHSFLYLVNAHLTVWLVLQQLYSLLYCFFVHKKILMPTRRQSKHIRNVHPYSIRSLDIFSNFHSFIFQQSELEPLKENNGPTFWELLEALRHSDSETCSVHKISHWTLHFTCCHLLITWPLRHSAHKLLFLMKHLSHTHAL
jgi:hypothetical protein